MRGPFLHSEDGGDSGFGLLCEQHLLLSSTHTAQNDRWLISNCRKSTILYIYQCELGLQGHIVYYKLYQERKSWLDIQDWENDVISSSGPYKEEDT